MRDDDRRLEEIVLSCPTYWISDKPKAVFTLPCEGQAETITFWRCGVCDEWHSLSPSCTAGEDEEFQSLNRELLSDEWTEKDYRPSDESDIPFNL